MNNSWGVHGEFQPHLNPGGSRQTDTQVERLEGSRRFTGKNLSLWKWSTAPDIPSEGCFFSRPWGQFKWRRRIIWSLLNCRNWFKGDDFSELLRLNLALLYLINAPHPAFVSMTYGVTLAWRCSVGQQQGNSIAPLCRVNRVTFRDVCQSIQADLLKSVIQFNTADLKLMIDFDSFEILILQEDKDVYVSEKPFTSRLLYEWSS